MKGKALCVFFSRSPFCKNSKTRIRNSKIFNEDSINLLHTSMILHLLDMLSKIDLIRTIPFWASKLSEQESELIEKEFPGLREQYTQLDGEFSKRFNHALSICHSKDDSLGTILIGSDCPLISQEIIEEAVKALAEDKCVYGPDDANGFYLIAIPAGTKIKDFTSVFEENSQEDAFLNLYKEKEICILPELYDIDTSDDLNKFLKYLVLDEQKYAYPRFDRLIKALA